QKLAVRVIKFVVSIFTVVGVIKILDTRYSESAPAREVTFGNYGPVECEDKFKSTLAENLNVVKNYPRGTADEFMWKIGGNLSAPDDIPKFPVIVTAIDSLHYPESMGLFRSIHQGIMGNRKYSGLLKTKCRCEVRSFPFTELPEHVRTKETFAFKPIIIQILLVEFGFVCWVDASIRFTTPDIDVGIQFAIDNSLLFYVRRDVSKSYTIARQTDSKTFTFLKEDVCKFRNFTELVGGFLMFHYDTVSKVIVNAWASCALNKQCISPDKTPLKPECNLRHTQDGRCHKFDQSVLSILIRHVIHDTNEYPPDRQLDTIFEIRKNEIDNYFENCNPILKCYS
ncbi:uncharacterized protein LOC132741071, partial [Ruditapes philippinarum]|uniref:uncharacterized protein LOC132741071 n=1 Tax=Ruditapes philippinarum TaxID=129788 RepID=UPI00295A6A6C